MIKLALWAAALVLAGRTYSGLTAWTRRRLAEEAADRAHLDCMTLLDTCALCDVEHPDDGTTCATCRLLLDVHADQPITLWPTAAAPEDRP